MKERPILFSGPMVRALLEGRKTQTRRAVKVQPFFGEPGEFDKHGYAKPELRDDGWWACDESFGIKFGWQIGRCPYGQPGDRLWVRETWSPDHSAFYPHFPTVYAADGTVETEGGMAYSPEARTSYPFRWRPSIHMPRAACRLTLEITGVRVERAHRITDADVRAEGVDPASIDNWRKWIDPRDAHGQAFGVLWDSINGKGAWAANPWVWVVEFKRTEARP